MSGEKDKAEKAKQPKEDEPKWPGTVDTGKEFDDWLAESNRKAEGE